MVTATETSFESAMTRLKKVVYKNRVRVKEFLVDFDKLRGGFVYPNHFCTALSMAGLDKVLSPQVRPPGCPVEPFHSFFGACERVAGLRGGSRGQKGRH